MRVYNFFFSFSSRLFLGKRGHQRPMRKKRRKRRKNAKLLFQKTTTRMCNPTQKDGCPRSSEPTSRKVLCHPTSMKPFCHVFSLFFSFLFASNISLAQDTIWTHLTHLQGKRSHLPMPHWKDPKAEPPGNRCKFFQRRNELFYALLPPRTCKPFFFLFLASTFFHWLLPRRASQKQEGRKTEGRGYMNVCTKMKNKN